MKDYYREGLTHGYEDAKAWIRGILTEDLTDAKKLEKIAAYVAPPPTWTDTGSGPGHEEPYDPRD